MSEFDFSTENYSNGKSCISHLLACELHVLVNYCPYTVSSLCYNRSHLSRRTKTLNLSPQQALTGIRKRIFVKEMSAKNTFETSAFML